MNNKIISIVIVLVLIVGGIFLFNGRSSAPTETDTETESEVLNEGEGSAAGILPKTVEVAISANNFAYDMKNITIEKGDTVKLTLTNTEGMHDLKIDELGVATKVLKAGESETVEFHVDEAGTYEYYCSVGTHRQMGMVGTLTVTE